MNHNKQWIYFFAQRVLAVAFRVLFGIKIHGKDKVPLEGKILLAPNHRSYLDPPLSGVGLPREVFYFAKRELFKNPLLGAFLQRLNARPVRRGGVDKEAIRTIESLLAQQHAVVIFPEGTRCRIGDFLKPKKGISLVALRTNTDIIPVAILGTRSWKKSLIHRGRMSVNYGDVIRCEDAKKQGNSSQQRQWIVDKIEKFWQHTAQLTAN